MKLQTAEWLDNPIFMKQVRAKLRGSQLVPGIVVVGALQLLLAWFGASNNAFSDRRVFLFNLAIQGVLLVIIGGSQVGSTVSATRESGILDFHRISPLSPWSITLGFFFGAPVMQYLLFAATLPMSLICVFTGGVSIATALEFLVLALLVAWLIYAVAMLSALSAKRATKGGPVGVIVMLLILSTNLFAFLMSSWPRFEGQLMLPFFDLHLPWLLTTALYLLPPTGFALIASMRKIRSERAHPLSKAQALAFLGTATVLVLGGVWRVKNQGYIVIIVVYALAILGMFMCLTITPTAGEYARGVRRAARQGRKHLHFLDDLAMNRLALMGLCGIVLFGATIAWNCIEGRNPNGQSFSLSIAVGVLTVAYFGLAYQLFSLAAPSRPGTLLALFVFLIWVVPAIAIPVAAAARLPEPILAALGGFTPVTGLAMVSGQDLGVQSPDVARLASLVPAIGLPFLFNNLVVSFRRRIDQVGQPVKAAAPVDESIVLELDE